MSDRDEYRLTLRALPSERPVEVRLRLALKYLLRAQALRCVSMERVKERVK